MPRAAANPADPLRDASRGVRLQKAMAEAGVGSRRRCEELIADGAVRVNGRTVTELPAWVDPAEDEIIISGRRLPKPARHLYIMLHKPRAVLTTRDDPGGRRTVADLVRHPSGARLHPVGRLEYESTGLVLMTNDGELTDRLTHARYGVPKVFWATVRGLVSPEQAAEIEAAASRAKQSRRRGDGPKRGTSSRRARVGVSIVTHEGGKTVLELTLAEGRNPEVERLLDEAGFPVRKVVQVALGPLRLSGVRMGEWRELRRDELRQLREAAFPAGG